MGQGRLGSLMGDKFKNVIMLPGDVVFCIFPLKLILDVIVMPKVVSELIVSWSLLEEVKWGKE